MKDEDTSANLLPKESTPPRTKELHHIMLGSFRLIAGAGNYEEPKVRLANVVDIGEG